MTIITSTNLIQAVKVTWQAIGHDVEDYAESNLECVEACIDADRLIYNANNKEANDELRELVSKHGYPRTLRAIAARCRLM